MTFAASQSAFADALLHADRPVPSGVTTSRGDVDAARFAVYRNNVFVGLTKALAQRFPVTEQLVGAEFFMAMARAYAQDHKPKSPLIIDYGDDFPVFISSFEPARPVAYLADVAKLEAAWTQAYHARDAVPLDLAALAAIAPEQLPLLKLAAHPSATLVRSSYPVGTIWAAHQSEQVVPVATWQPEAALVVRPEMTVTIHILPARDVAFLAALLASATLGEAVELALAGTPDFDFGTALVGLLNLGAFSAVFSDEG